MSLNDIPSFFQGNSQNLVVTITDTTGNIVDLSGSSFKWEMVIRPTSLIKDTTTGGIEITNAVGGEVTIKLTSQDTANLTGVYRHELEMTDASGDISTVLQDKIQILKTYID